MKYLLKSICSENKKYQINSTAVKFCIFQGLYSDWNKNNMSKYPNIINNIITRWLKKWLFLFQVCVLFARIKEIIQEQFLIFLTNS